MSLGLLFAKTSNMTLTNEFINELGKPQTPDVEPAPDRYSYALS